LIYLYALKKDGTLKWSTYVVQGSGIELFMDKIGGLGYFSSSFTGKVSFFI